MKFRDYAISIKGRERGWCKFLYSLNIIDVCIINEWFFTPKKWMSEWFGI